MMNKMTTVMRRAMQQLRAGDAMGATASIRGALGAATAPAVRVRRHMRPNTPPPQPGQGAEPAPGTGCFTQHHHVCKAGSRDYWLFEPSPRDEAPKGLVVMLHGCTQTPLDFARGTRMNAAAEAANFLVVYPGQTGAHNAQSCWNWFRPEDQRRDSGEPAILADLAATLARQHGLTGRCFAAGLSAGGAMAAILGHTHPDIFAAIGVHSGLPCGAAHDVMSAFSAMRGQGAEAGEAPRLPVIVFHGEADRTVSVANAEMLVPGSGVETRQQLGGRACRKLVTQDGSELWRVAGAGHAWFGGDPTGSFADPAGPDASAEMLRFFAAHAKG